MQLIHSYQLLAEVLTRKLLEILEPKNLVIFQLSRLWLREFNAFFEMVLVEVVI